MRDSSGMWYSKPAASEGLKLKVLAQVPQVGCVGWESGCIEEGRG